MLMTSGLTTGSKRVFLDTAPIIYFLDNHKLYGEKMALIIDELLKSEIAMVSSVITAEEYLVYPLRMKSQKAVDAFFRFHNDYEIPLVPVSLEIAEKAADIRAVYTHFKSMDALQLASALMMKCDLFLTNDKRLKQFRELPCIIVDEWPIHEEL